MPRVVIVLFVLLMRAFYPTCSLTVWWGTFKEMPIVEECNPYGADAFRTKRVYLNVDKAYAWTTVVMVEICRCPQAKFDENWE